MVSKENTQKEDSKERLIAVAKKLFAQKGFEGTSVKDICDEAGLNVSLVSYYFQGKDNLYQNILEQFGMERLNAAVRILKTPTSPQEISLRLKMFADEMFLCHVENPETTQIIHRECTQNFVNIQKIFEKTFLNVHSILIKFFKDAKNKNLIDKKRDPKTLASLFMGQIVHIARVAPISKNYVSVSIDIEKDREHLINEIVETFLHGASSRR